jgi:hypothetical protein
MQTCRPATCCWRRRPPPRRPHPRPPPPPRTTAWTAHATLDGACRAAAAWAAARARGGALGRLPRASARTTPTWCPPRSRSASSGTLWPRRARPACGLPPLPASPALLPRTCPVPLLERARLRVMRRPSLEAPPHLNNTTLRPNPHSTLTPPHPAHRPPPPPLPTPPLAPHLPRRLRTLARAACWARAAWRRPGPTPP